jgi:arginyl-tRNA synthetase
MQESIRTAIREALATLGVSECEFVVEHPADHTHGEYATNVAMVAAKRIGKSPREVATQLVRALEGVVPDVEHIEIAGPGFINFHVARRFYVREVARANEQREHWGTNDAYVGKKVMVEYTDPNPFKELHIGHLVPNALGESLACLMEMSGATVRRVTFQGDVGMHVAKGIYGLMQAGVEPGAISPEVLGRAYAEGATAFEADEATAAEIKQLNKRIYERSDEQVNALYDAGKKVSIEYFEKAYALLGSAFDHYFMESVTGPIGKELVMAHIGSVFTESEGAVIYEGEKRGLHTRVFVNAAGIPTYEAKDLGLVKAKHDWWPFDLSMTVTGTEQQHYFAVVASAVAEVLPELAGKVELVPNGMLRLSEGKMSSRTGNVVRALDLIDEVTTRVKEIMGERTLPEHEEVASAVAVAAIKYVILRSGAGKDIIFDLKASVSLDGDSGPYLQYAYARARSVLAKAEGVGIVPSTEDVPQEPYAIERLMYRFPEVIQRATESREPHHVATYLTELASAWNSFYASERIADPTDPHAPFKVALGNAVAHTLQNGLRALGIAAPEEM